MAYKTSQTYLLDPQRMLNFSTLGRIGWAGVEDNPPSGPGRSGTQTHVSPPIPGLALLLASFRPQYGPASPNRQNDKMKLADREYCRQAPTGSRTTRRGVGGVVGDVAADPGQRRSEGGYVTDHQGPKAEGGHKDFPSESRSAALRCWPSAPWRWRRRFREARRAAGRHLRVTRSAGQVDYAAWDAVWWWTPPATPSSAPAGPPPAPAPPPSNPLPVASAGSSTKPAPRPTASPPFDQHRYPHHCGPGGPSPPASQW
jgi:hypothetical protein